MDYTKMALNLGLDIDFIDNGMYLIKTQYNGGRIKICKNLEDLHKFLEFYSKIKSQIGLKNRDLFGTIY